MAFVSGRLLVAAPTLADPNFARTVVLMLAHGEEGALGLVLNRPSEIDVEVVLTDEWHEAAAAPPTLFFGGPVATESVIGLARVHGLGDGIGFSASTGTLGTVDLELSPNAIAGGIEVGAGLRGPCGLGSRPARGRAPSAGVDRRGCPRRRSVHG